MIDTFDVLIVSNRSVLRYDYQLCNVDRVKDERVRAVIEVSGKWVANGGITA